MLKSEAINNNLLMLLYSQLSKHQEQASVKKIAAGILEDLRPLYLKGVAYCIRQEAVEKEVISLLSSHDIGAIVIRGNEIAREIYGNPNCRASSDIDILMRKQDVLRADSILSGAGYKKDFQEPVGYSLARIHHAAYFHPTSGICIELHWNFGVPGFFNLTSADIWEEVLTRYPEDGKLSPEMSMIMLLIHHHSHSFRELRILLDLVWALYRYKDEIDWVHFTDRLEKIGLLRITWITLDQIQRLWKDTMESMPSFTDLKRSIENRDFARSVFLGSYFHPAIGIA
ncbi:MAG: nucleotidyltransferase family protein, partial [Thermodesulfovibrionales bacterium]